MFDVLPLYQNLERDEFDYPLLMSALRRLGYLSPAKKIHDLMKAGILVGVKKGLYVFASPYARGLVWKEALANLIYGPSYISLEYALAYHGLIPERVSTVTSVTSKRNKVFKTPLGEFSYRHLSLEKYREGIDLSWMDSKHPVLMAVPEKALCDFMTLKKVPAFKNPAQAGKFLTEDLRIDFEHSRRFNPLLMHRLNRIYKSKTIDSVLSFLEGVHS